VYIYYKYMVDTVTKRDGKEEEFDFEKIKNGIRHASSVVDVADTRAEELGAMITNALMEEFSDRAKATTSEIREFVLGELDKHEPSVGEAWRTYDVERTAL
jgi:transcriptional regulator NrdR family protein